MRIIEPRKILVVVGVPVVVVVVVAVVARGGRKYIFAEVRGREFIIEETNFRRDFRRTNVMEQILLPRHIVGVGVHAIVAAVGEGTCSQEGKRINDGENQF